MSDFKTYDPGRIVIVVNGILIEGIADGTFVKISRMTPSFSSKAGAGGAVIRTKSRDKRGKIELTLLPSSPSNDRLSALVTADENVDAGVGAVGPSLVKELNGTTICAGGKSWVTQPSDDDDGGNPVNRSCTIEIAELSVISIVHERLTGKSVD